MLSPTRDIVKPTFVFYFSTPGGRLSFVRVARAITGSVPKPIGGEFKLFEFVDVHYVRVWMPL